jgi:hypothetical protein
MKTLSKTTCRIPIIDENLSDDEATEDDDIQGHFESCADILISSRIPQ